MSKETKNLVNSLIIVLGYFAGLAGISAVVGQVIANWWLMAWTWIIGKLGIVVETEED